MRDDLEKREERLLSRLRKQWDEPDVGAWEQYLGLFDKAIKEAQISNYKFDKIGEFTTKSPFNSGASTLRDDQRSAIERVLRGLPLSHQKILNMTFWQGLSVREIAKILGLPRSTVNRWKYAAIKEMRRKSGTNY